MEKGRKGLKEGAERKTGQEGRKDCCAAEAGLSSGSFCLSLFLLP